MEDRIDIDRLQQMLSAVKEISEQEKSMWKEREERGENFNVFDILGRAQDELSHSRIIAELLDPHGAHGYGDLFLKMFLEIADESMEMKWSSISVDTEYFIGWKDENEREGGKIDIFISDKAANAVIIENKIYAGDQPHQLQRYENFAKKNGYRYKIFYLTLNGNLASADSSNHQHVEYQPISYRYDILNWLNRCFEASYAKANVNNVIKQYMDCIKNTLNIMSENNLKRLVEVCTDEMNVEQTMAILNQQEDIKYAIRRKFVEQIKAYAEARGLDCEERNDLAEYWENESWIIFHDPRQSENWGLFFGMENNTKGSGGVGYGISYLKENHPKLLQAELKTYPSVFSEYRQTKDYPLGWNYIRDERYSANATWWDWNDNSTIEDMINGKMLKFVQEEIIEPVLRERYLEKLERHFEA